MKILVLSNLYPPDVIGGYEVACGQMSAALARRGHHVRVLTSAPRRPVPDRPNVLRNLKLTDIWNREWMERQPPPVQHALDARSRLVDAFNARQLMAALEEFGPDVCYVFNPTGLGGLGLMAALQFLGVPWAWHLADSVPAYVCSIWGRVVPALASAFARDLDGTFIGVSTRLIRDIEAQGIDLPGQRHVLAYWIDGRPAPARPGPHRAGDRTLRIVNAGRLTPYKGVDLLLEAVANLKRASLRVELDLIGEAADVAPSHYPDLVERLDLTDRVRLLGPVAHDRLVRGYADYDVFAFPTWDREPFGLGPVEAAFHGGCVPLIAQHCGLAEWLVHGVHCVKAEATADAFAAAIHGLADGAIPLAPLARRAAALARREMHVDTIAPRIERILAESAGRRLPPRGTRADAERLLQLAEKLTDVLIAEHHAAA